MTDRPIIFSARMVQALLAGRKTQTRRLYKVPAGSYVEQGRVWAMTDGCAYGDAALPYAPGDRLYVREAWRTERGQDRQNATEIAAACLDAGYSRVWCPTFYEVDAARVNFENGMVAGRYRHARFMPRWASRLTLTVTEVRVQRLQDISEADAWAEGCKPGTLDDNGDPFPAEEPHPKGGWIGWDNARDWYADLWESLHGPDAWATNPWVVAVSFTVQHGNIDAGGDHG